MIDQILYELPLLYHETITYGFYNNVVSTALFLLTAAYLLNLTIRWTGQRNQDWNEMPRELAITLSSIAFFLMILGATCELNEAVKAKVAPRLYFVEHIRNKI